MQALDNVSVSLIPEQGGCAHASDIHARVARAMAHYTTDQERELAILNLRWLSGRASTHAEQVECRMLLLAMRNALSFGVS